MYPLYLIFKKVLRTTLLPEARSKPLCWYEPWSGTSCIDIRYPHALLNSPVHKVFRIWIKVRLSKENIAPKRALAAAASSPKYAHLATWCIPDTSWPPPPRVSSVHTSPPPPRHTGCCTDRPGPWWPGGTTVALSEKLRMHWCQKKLIVKGLLKLLSLLWYASSKSLFIR